MTRRESGEPIAIVGMACRYPDAGDPAELWKTVLHQRRAFRRLPPGRLNLADHWSADASAPDRTYSTQAAVLADWQFDRESFRIPGAAFRAADPAHWLALETADRALADAGHPAGAGLDADRVAVVVGNSLTGEVTRARTLRLRWPYVRDVLRATLPEADLAEVEKRYLAAFPEVGDETLAGSLANTIAGRICNHFGFHGGGYTVDGACASSMLAVITACRALRDGGADFALAGGVDLSLDPFELVGFAKAGALAAEEMRIYDERSAGFWPGEGCGMLALARAEDACAAGWPVYAEILGWGVSSDGRGGITRPEADGQLLALRRAGEMAGIEHAEIGLYEGHGTGTAVGDLVELTALNRVRPGARPAALGSVKANIGHTKAAAGAAGVVKAALSLSSGLLPPTTGCAAPHPALGGSLRVLSAPEPWPDGPRFAGVSAMGFGGINTHVVLGAPARPRSIPSPVAARPTPEFDVLAVSGPDPGQVAAELSRIAETAPRLSRGELHDLACQYGRRDAAGPVRAALVVRTPAELASLATRAAAEIGSAPPGQLATTPGLWLGHTVPGRVALLFPGQGASGAEPADTALAQPAIYRASRAALSRLEGLGVTASAAIGHSLGELTALVWAGCLSPEDGERLAVERGRIMGEYGTRGTGMLTLAASAAEARTLCAGTEVVLAADNSAVSQVLSGSMEELRSVAEAAERRGFRVRWLPVSHGFHSPAMAACAGPWRAFLDGIDISPVRRTVMSTVYGRRLTEEDDLVELLVTQLCAPVQFRAAVQAVEADLFCEAGPGRALSALAGPETPTVSLGVGDRAAADSAAALFAAGAAANLVPWFAGRAARPIDLGHEPEFLTNPCAAAPSVIPAPRMALDTTPARDAAATVTGLLAEATELDAALIGTETRLLADLNLSSLRATQLVVEAASALGRTLPSVSMAFADSSVGEVIAEIERLPETAEPDAGASVPGVRPWLACFTEALVPARPEPWRPTETSYVTDAEDVEALLDLGRKALRHKALAVITHDCALGGFLRSLHREHPDVGITLAQVPPGAKDFSALHAEPGRFRELILGEDGVWYEPREQLVSTATGKTPLDDQDVLLVSGGGKGIGYACAQALAISTGLALAIIGRSRPETDELLQSNLDQLRADGIRVAYEAADVGDPDAVALAVEKLTAETGLVTALLHASGINEPARFADLTADQLRAHLRPKIAGLRALLAAVPPESLRLLVTFGSMIGSAGMPGECHYALANGILRAEARRLARQLPTCRVFDIAWSAWSGAGMAERMGAAQALARTGATPIPVEEGTELFLRLLRTPATPADVSVHGRLGDEPSPGTGRFLQRIRARHPAVELVADATLSLRTDPWLDGHRVDGTALLPAVVGLEAMAQAASTVAGRALTTARDVKFDRPVIVPDTGETVVRVCALREDDAVTTVLRCAGSDFLVDHFSATFPMSAVESTAEPPVVAEGGRIEPSDLYDRLLFHNGQFRRVTEVAVPDPWSCQAVITPDDPWFTSVLGDPAAHDATVHVLQACVPTRRLLPVGCDRVDFDPRAAGPWHLRGTEQHAADGRYTWNVAATDANGRTAVRWTGLRLADTGPLPDDQPWPPHLLSVAITRTAVALGLDPSLRVSLGEPFTVAVDSSCPAACAWEFVEPQEPPDPGLLRVISGPCAEPPDRLAARASTVSRCLAEMGANPSEARFSGAYDGGWLVLSAGRARIASAVFTVDGCRLPVAIALLTTGGSA